MTTFWSVSYTHLVRKIGRKGAVDDDQTRIQGVENIVQADAHVFQEAFMDPQGIGILIPREPDQLI